MNRILLKIVWFYKHGKQALNARKASQNIDELPVDKI